jgi:ligand-binding sensor domain-containing protein
MRLFVGLFLLFQTIAAQDLHDWQVITNMNDVTDTEYLIDEIWVSSSGGIYRFNTSDSTSIKYTNIDGLASLNINVITKDKYGNLMAGSKEGILCLYHAALDNWSAYFEIQGNEIVDLNSYHDTLWVATNAGIGVYINRQDRLEFRDYYDNLPLIPETGYRVSVFNSRIYYATKRGLLYASSNFFKNNLKIENAWKILSINNGLPSNEVFDLAPFEDKLYIATSQGAVFLDQNFTVNQVGDWTRGAVNRIIHSESKMYFIQAKSYYLKEENTWTFVNSFTTSITSGVIDADNNLWLGLERGGLRRDGWNKSLLIDGPATNHVGVLIKDRGGQLWMAAGKFKLYFFEGFYKYDFQSWTNFKFSDNLWHRKNATDYVYEDKHGNIWFGSWGGGAIVVTHDDMIFYHAWPDTGRLTISDVNGESVVELDEVAPEARDCLVGAAGTESYTVITHFIEDVDGNLWCSNFQAKEPKYLTVIPNSNPTPLPGCSDWKYFGDQIGMSLDDGEISCLEFDYLGRLWIGTFRKGILVFDYNGTLANESDDRLYRISMTDNLYSNTILSIKVDYDGVIWIGTDGGLNSYQADLTGTSQTIYGHAGDAGPVDNKINQIYIDEYNNKWFATDGGLSVLKADRSAWDQNAWVHYTTDNSGLPSPVVNSVYVDSQAGEAYLGTEAGLAIFSGSYSQYKSDLSTMIGGPNPYVISDGSKYMIKNMVPNATVKIFDINGRLTQILSQENGTILGSRAYWDGKDSKNNLVSSGIYIYLVFNDEGITGRGKIAVVKP